MANDRNRPQAPNAAKGPQFLTDRIRATEIRLIYEGENSIVPRAEAERLAQETGLDLMIVSLDSAPPVVRLVDYGKFKYEAEKKAREARKHQHQVTIKEVKMSVRIDDHDYNVKVNNAKKFLSEDDKVKLSIRLRGREMQHSELAFNLARSFITDLEGVGVADNQPRLEGRQIVLVLSPDKKALKKQSTGKDAVIKDAAPKEAEPDKVPAQEKTVAAAEPAAEPTA